MIACAARSAGY